ncbi:MAG: translocation/assembly module TamB [Desulfobulbaceae bacterium]|nr:translocation/assembly module TamB [Desulfobulbaceae bacterium]
MKTSFRTSFWVAAAGAVVMLTALVALKDVALFPFAEWYVKAALREEFATTLTLERIEGNLVSEMRITGIKLKPEGNDKVLSLLQAEEIVLRYHLPDLLGGRENFLLHIECDIRRAQVALALDGGRTDPTLSGTSGSFSMPFFLPRVRLDDSDLQIRLADGYSVQASGMSGHFGMNTPDKPFSSFFSSENLTFSKGGQSLFSSGVTGTFLVSRSGIDIESLLFADRQIVRHGSFLFARKNSSSDNPFTADILPFAGGVQVSGVLSGQVAKVSLTAQDFDLTKAIEWIPQIKGSISGKLQGTADFAVHFESQPFFQGSFSLAARDGSLQDYPFQELIITAAIDPERVSLEKAMVRTPSHEALLRDFSFAYDFSSPLSLTESARGLHGDFSLQSRDIPALLQSMGVESRAGLNDAPSHMLSLSGSVDGKMVRVNEGKLISDTMQIDIGTSSLGLPGPNQSFAQMPLSIRLNLLIDSLQEAASIFSLPDVAGKARAKVDLSGSFAALSGTGRFSAKDLAYQGMMLGELDADLVADSKTVSVRGFSLKNRGDFLSGEGVLRLAGRHIENMQLRADFQPESALLSSLLPDGMSCKGPVLAKISGQGPLGDPDFFLQLETGELAVGIFPITKTTFSLQKERAHFTLHQLRVQSPNGDLNIAGASDKDAAKGLWDYKLGTFDINTGKSSFRLQEQGAGQVVWPRIEIDALRFASDQSRVSVSGLLDLPGNSSLKVAVSGLSSDQLPFLFPEDGFGFQDADASIQFDGTRQNPALRSMGSVAELSSPQLPLPLQGNFDIAYQNRRMTLHHFLWTSADGIRLKAGGSFPFDPRADDMFPVGSLSLQAHIFAPEISAFDAFMADFGSAGGSLDMDVDLSGSWQEPLGHIRIDGQNVNVPEFENYEIPLLSSVSAELIATRDTLLLKDVKVLAEGSELTLQGRWTDPPGLADLLSGQWRDQGGDMHAVASLSMEDVGDLSLPLEGVRRISGRVKADATVDGRPGSFQFVGTVSLQHGEMLADFLPASAREISMKADFDQEKIVLAQMRAELGGAPLSASGTIAFAEDGPVSDILVKGDNLLLVRNDGMLIRSDAQILLSGPLDSWNISGEMAITDGRITRQVDFIGMLKGDRMPESSGEASLFSFPSPPLRDAHLNIEITARKPLLIRNSLFNGTIRPQLTLKGTGEVPFLEGRVYIDPSKVKLPAGRLLVESGIISYPKENPDQPALDIKAAAKMLGYDITVQIHGNLDEPVVTLSSVPPVPSDQLLLLLLTGYPPARTFSAQGRQKGNMRLALYFGRDFLGRWLYDEDVDDESVLERIDLDIGRDVTRSGDDTIEASFELGRDTVKGTGVYYITAEKDIYDDFNMGLKIVFRLAD